MKRILITIGYKKRELEYICLLSAFLEKNGFEVKIVYANFQVYSELFIWQPDYLLLGQVNQNENIAIAQYASASGIIVCVLNCEGIYDPSQEISRFGSNINSYVDVLFAWGTQHKKDAIKSTDIEVSKIFVTGTPKFDLYKQPFIKHINTNKPYASKLHSKRKVLCIATSLAAAETSWKHVEHNVAYQKYGKEFFEKRTLGQRTLRDNFIKLAKVLAKDNKYDIVFRVHPLETLSYYTDRLSDVPNIIFDNSIHAIQLFSVIDLLVHRSSTLATEAWIREVATVNFDPIHNADRDMLEFTKSEPIFNSEKKLVEWIKKEQFIDATTTNKKKKFLKNWYGFETKSDRLSSLVISNVIQETKVKIKHRKFHTFFLPHMMLMLIKIILRKKYIYEVIALFKGKIYIENMKELHITQEEVFRLVKMYRSYID